MMNCEQIQDLLDQYLDGRLEAETVQQVEEHLSHCEECAKLFTVCKDLRKEEGPAPSQFSQSWRAAVRREEKMEKRNANQKGFRNLLVIAAAFVFVIGGTLMTRDKAAPADNNTFALYSTAGTADMANAGGAITLKRSLTSEENSYSPAPASVAGGMSDGMEESDRQAKLIRNVDFTIRTLEFESVVQQLQTLTLSNDGRVEYISQFGDHNTGEMRNASLTLRIPSEKLDGFLETVESVGNVSSFTSRVEDVTESYYDVQARLETQLKKMERLQELLLEAKEMSDLLQVESSIADTQYMIDSYQSQLKGMDDDVNYSTVSVFVQETRVVEAEEASFIQRIGAGIVDSVSSGVGFLGDAVVFILSIVPWLLLLAVIILIVKAVSKKRKK